MLVDTSVWVAHLRHGNVGLDTVLNEDRAVCHPFIIGELALGNLRNRREILDLLNALPSATVADHEEVLQFIEAHHLAGAGIGYVDAHLLASARITGIELWTLDKAFARIVGALT